MKVRRRGTKLSRGRACSGTPKPSQLRSSLPPPQPNSPSPDPPKPSLLQASLPPLKPSPLSPDPPQSSQLCSSLPRRGTRRCRGRGSDDPPQPSQQHTSLPLQEPTPLSPDHSQPSQLRSSSSPPQPSQQLTRSPPPQPTPFSPGATSTGSPLTPGDQSNPASHSADTPSRHLILRPSGGGSHVITDRRKVISVEAVSNPRRFVPQMVTRDIISTVIMQMPTPIERWKNYPADMKDALFKDFMDKYQFASDYDRKMARTVWERTCMDRYPDHLKNIREVALKQVKSTDLADTKGHGPKGMRTEVWDGLLDIWLSPDWRKKSDAARSNRAAKPDSMLHTGGSISFGEHKKRMEAEMKQPISHRDVYDHVHKTKDGDYVSQRSRNFIESYDSAMSQKYGRDSSTHPMVDTELWTKVSGPNKKRRVLGGHSLDIDIDGSKHTPCSNVTCSSLTQEAIKEAVNAAMTSFVQTKLVPMLEPILSRIVGSQTRNLASQAPSQGGAASQDFEEDDD